MAHLVEVYVDGIVAVGWNQGQQEALHASQLRDQKGYRFHPDCSLREPVQRLGLT